MFSGFRVNPPDTLKATLASKAMPLIETYNQFLSMKNSGLKAEAGQIADGLDPGVP